MEFKKYIGKNILAWLSYNPNYEDMYRSVNKVCRVYPRILIDGNSYELIDSNDFPKYGLIDVRVQGDDSAEDVHLRFGSLVSIRINKEPFANYDGNHMYSLKYNYQFGKVNSEIWIESFTGKGYYQIIDVESNITTLQNTREISEPNFTICTT